MNAFSPLPLAGEDRLLVVAPHPDDESIAAGLLLQRAAALGAKTLVITMTHGDAFGYAGPNPAPRRSAKRRTRRLGIARREESERALARLGVDPADAVYLGYPDRGLAPMWGDHWDEDAPYRSPFTLRDHSPYERIATPGAVHAGARLLADLKDALTRFEPTVAVYPHPGDAHGDHWATSVFLSSALSELADAGAAWAKACRRYWYVVHRGAWPGPKGLHPHLPMKPPPKLNPLSDVWFEVTGSPEMVQTKRDAILEHRTQLPLLGRFLLSFARSTELFAEAVTPKAKSVTTGSMLLGSSLSPWSARPLVRDPAQDTVARQVERAGDILSLDVAADGQTLYVKVGLAAKVAPDVEYRFSFYDSPRTIDLTLRFRMPARVAAREGNRWVKQTSVVARVREDNLELAIPLSALRFPRRLFIGVATRARRIVVDRTGPHQVELAPAKTDRPSLVFAQAKPGDLLPCSRLFLSAFEDSIRRVFGRMPPEALVRQVFQLCYDAEPDALVVALQDGQAVGYAYAPKSLRGVWRTALVRGHLFRMAASVFRGRFRLGWTPLRILMLDKFAFLRSSVGGELSAEARILSIAVAQSARNQGIGAALARHALRRFQALGVPRVRLEVRPWNAPAIRLYEKLGFKVRGETKDTQGEWWIMLLDLPPGPSRGKERHH